VDEPLPFDAGAARNPGDFDVLDDLLEVVPVSGPA